MAYPPRRSSSAKDKAEAMFKAATTKSVDVPPRPDRTAVPIGKETVSLPVDRDVLAFFQDAGPGWRQRMNAALRKAAGLS